MKKEYKKLIKSKKFSFKKNLISEIKNSSYNSKILWNKISNLKQLDDTTNNDTTNISPKSWLKYFSELGCGNNARTLTKNHVTVGNLDYPFLLEDLDIAIKKLKNKKSAGPDLIINEMIKCLY